MPSDGVRPLLAAQQNCSDLRNCRQQVLPAPRHAPRRPTSIFTRKSQVRLAIRGNTRWVFKHFGRGEKHVFKVGPRRADQPCRPLGAKTANMHFHSQFAGQIGPWTNTLAFLSILEGCQATPRTAPVPPRRQLGLPHRRLTAPSAWPRRQLNFGLVRRRTNLQLID